MRRISHVLHRSRFVRFLFVGAIGFAVDAGGTQASIALGMTPMTARIVPLASAVLVTWWLNRVLTFEVRAAARPAELLRYAAVALSGATMNYLLYSALLWGGVHPMIAIAAATVLLLLYSYAGYRHAVFRRADRRATMKR